MSGLEVRTMLSSWLQRGSAESTFFYIKKIKVTQ